jgi:hypothetical protein
MRIALFLVILVLLFATNPGPASFREFVADRAGEIVQSSRVNLLPGGGLLGSLGAGLAGRIASEFAHRDNYFLFSIYTLDFDGPNRRGQEWKFLGIASRFVELDRPEALAKND